MFKRNDWIVGIVSVLLGIFVLVVARGFHEQTSMDSAGPGGVPSMLAWGILAIGIIHLAGAFFFAPKPTEERKGKWLKELDEFKPVLQIALACAIYILVLEYLGYLIATPLLIAAIMMIVKVRKVSSVLLTAIATTAVLFLVFDLGLKVRLPMGFLSAFFS